MINGRREFPCIADSGASQTTISREMAECCGMVVQRSEKSETISLATSELTVTVVSEVSATLEIKPGAGSTAIVARNVPVWILEERMDEVLLGDDVLKLLGINVEELLARKAGDDVDYLGDEEAFPYLGGDKEDKILQIMAQKIKEAKANGLKEPDKWERLLVRHIDEFRTILGHDPPAKLPALKIHWDKERASAVRPARIPYTLEQKQFLDHMVENLIQKGYAYENASARYVSESLVIPKVENPQNLEEDWRLVVNLKKPNYATEPMYWPLPTLEEVQQHLHGAKVFMTLDLKNGYFQIELDESCRELFSFSTHRHVLTPTRIPQGCTDAVMYFTYLMLKTFHEKVYHGIVPWLDDLLLYSDSEEGLLELLRWVLERAEAIGLKFSPKKMSLYTTSIRWCGKLVTPQGIEVDPCRKEALVNMPLPTVASDLMQFLNAAGWIRTHMPMFSTTTSRLQDWLNSLLGGGRRTSRRARSIKLVWTEERKKWFEQSKEMILHSVSQGHPNPEAEFCLFTDASDTHWGAVLVQIANFQVLEDVLAQQVDPLAFLSGAFKGSQRNWSTVEKEAFAILEAVERLRYLLIRPNGFRIYTDHHNLVFMYGSSASRKLNVQARLDRWALKLQSYRFTIEHVPGVKNLWADLLSRWGACAGPTSRLAAIRSITPGRTEGRGRGHKATPRIFPLEKMEWPDVTAIRRSQVRAVRPPELVEHDGIWYSGDRVWIPDDENIKQQLMVIAHYGLGGHNGVAGTMEKLQAKCIWRNMRKEVSMFVKDCILCRCAKSTAPTNVHLGEHVRPTRPNQCVHFDYYYIGNSRKGSKYLLVIRDGFSRFTMLQDYPSATSCHAIDGLLSWISLFGVPERFFSDNGPHFRNRIMSELCRSLSIAQEFSTVYCAWANGLAERVMRDVKALFKIMIHGTRVDRNDWPVLVSNVMFAINQRPSRILGNKTPVEVHMGMLPTNPLSLVFETNGQRLEKVNWVPNMIEYLNNLTKTLDILHQDAFDATAKKNKSMRSAKEDLPIFEIGDYVLFCIFERPRPNGKLFFEWVGPMQIVDTKSEYVYQIKDLVDGRLLDAHVTRLSYYSNSQMHVTGELRHLIAREGLAYEVEKLVGIQRNDELNLYQVRVRWLGFGEHEESLEPFDHMLAEVPMLVLNYLDVFSKTEPREWKQFWSTHKQLVLETIKSRRYDMKSFDFIK